MLSVYLHITAWLHKSKKVEQHLVVGGGGWQKVCLQMKYFLDVEKKSFLYNFLCERIIINKDIYHYFNSYLIRKKKPGNHCKSFQGAPCMETFFILLYTNVQACYMYDHADHTFVSASFLFN